MKQLFTAFTALAMLAGVVPATVNAEDYRRNEREWHQDRESIPHDQGRREFRHEREREIRRDIRREERWERGHALPYEYRREVVSNYDYYHLRRPPRGYHWVRANGDYLLVAIASGIIADVILHH